jgi:hypothetical protein
VHIAPFSFWAGCIREHLDVAFAEPLTEQATGGQSCVILTMS